MKRNIPRESCTISDGPSLSRIKRSWCARKLTRDVYLCGQLAVGCINTPALVRRGLECKKFPKAANFQKTPAEPVEGAAVRMTFSPSNVQFNLMEHQAMIEPTKKAGGNTLLREFELPGRLTWPVQMRAL